MMSTIHLMLEHKLTPEDVDAITGAPMAHPKSASFRTGDLVGLDTFAHVAQNCWDSLTTDEEREVFKLPSFMATMIEKKILGDKTKGGFYKKAGKEVATFDPYTLEYRAKGGDEAIKATCKKLGKVEDPSERVRKLMADDGVAGTAEAPRLIGAVPPPVVGAAHLDTEAALKDPFITPQVWWQHCAASRDRNQDFFFFALAETPNNDSDCAHQYQCAFGIYTEPSLPCLSPNSPYVGLAFTCLLSCLVLHTSIRVCAQRR
jgi:hypothetical protein